MVELSQDRVVGAVRFLDGITLQKIAGSLRVEAADAVIRANASGLYVIWSAPTGPLQATVSDPSASYLTRRFTVPLPRDSDPTHAEQANSIFQSVDVRLLPSPNMAVFTGWAILRARVRKSGSSVPLAGALIRITETDNQKLLATGMSDSRGEALVAVPGVPVTTFDSGDGAVTATEIDVQIQTVFNPTATGVPDPDELEAQKATLPSSTINAKLASGRVLVIELAVTFA